MPKRKLPKDQRVLTCFQGYYSHKKQAATTSRIACALNARPLSNIVIPYRDDGRVRGNGAYFDHQTLQSITHAPTTVVNLSQQETHITEYMQSQTTVALEHGATSPVEVTDMSRCEGLLFLPGIPRNIKDSGSEILEERKKTNATLIKDALLRGKPILSVCGGSWDLWTYFDGKLKAVRDHNCSQGMPRINALGKVNYNKQVHRIQLTEDGSILAGAMQYHQNKNANPFPPVNSVHWLAADANTTPPFFNISALSVADTSLSCLNRQQRMMEPEENTVEAFESAYGAPLIGVQWHPEAYTINTPNIYFPEQQRSLLKYMVAAGQAYIIKRAVLDDISQRVRLFDNNRRRAICSQNNLLNLKRTSLLLFSDTEKTCKYHKQESKGQISTSSKLV